MLQYFEDIELFGNVDSKERIVFIVCRDLIDWFILNYHFPSDNWLELAHYSSSYQID